MVTRMDDPERFYERFHEHVVPLGAIPAADSFTYQLVFDLIRPFATGGSRVLDIGCGGGALALHLATQGCAVIGTDISPSATAAAARAAGKHGLDDRVRFETADDEHLPDGPFDLVTMVEVLEHLPDPEGALRRLCHRLRPGGHLVVTVPSQRSLPHRTRMRVRGRDSFDERVGHLRRYTARTLREAVEGGGFEVVALRPGEGPLRNAIFSFDALRRVPGALDSFPRARGVVQLADRAAARLLGEAQLLAVGRRPPSES